jgi:hypothetical protein
MAPMSIEARRLTQRERSTWRPTLARQFLRSMNYRHAPFVQIFGKRRSDSAISALWYLPTSAMVLGEAVGAEGSKLMARILAQKGRARRRQFFVQCFLPCSMNAPAPCSRHWSNTTLPTASRWDRARSRFSGLDLSPATIRNVMADLEEAGFVASPHTSAGRVPTPRGYRLFVDTLLTVRPLEARQIDEMEAPAASAGRQQQVISSASHLLSSLTHFAGVVMAPRRATPAASARSSSSV